MKKNSKFYAIRSVYKWEKRSPIPHQHDCIQILHISSGCGRVETADGIWIVPPNRGVLIPPHKLHSASSSKAFEVNNLYFPQEYASLFVSKTCFVFNVTPLLKELFDHVVRLPSVDFDSDYGETLFLTILHLVKRQNHQKVEFFIPSPKDARLKKLAKMILSDLSLRSQLSQICMKAGISPRTAQRLFLKETKMTLTQWTNHHRIFSSMEKLLLGKSVTEVSFEVGFESSASFSHCFKKFVGVSPKKFLEGSRGELPS
jgi:AraC-like DNA-binding protein